MRAFDFPSYSRSIFYVALSSADNSRRATPLEIFQSRQEMLSLPCPMHLAYLPKMLDRFSNDWQRLTGNLSEFFDKWRKCDTVG